MDKLLKEWKHRLGLDDWRIVVEWDCPLTEFVLKDVCGETEYQEVNKSAIIRIMSKKDYGERLIPYDAERILVHELLHCKFCYIQETENETQNRVVHSYIEDLARALVDAKRCKNKIIEKKQDKDDKISVLEKAYKKACKKLSDIYGECPYSDMNLEMPNYCDDECGEHEELLCWDIYFKEQAEKELKNEQ